MVVRLLWVERSRSGEELGRREETLQGESEKNPTRNYVGRLIARYHPELTSAGKVHLIDCEEPGYRWYVRSAQFGSNSWITTYAEPLSLDGSSKGDA
jgi:hypothetical protein